MLNAHPGAIDLGQRVDIRDLKQPMLALHSLEQHDRFRRLAERPRTHIDVTAAGRLATNRFDQHVEPTFNSNERPLTVSGTRHASQMP